MMLKLRDLHVTICLSRLSEPLDSTPLMLANAPITSPLDVSVNPVLTTLSAPPQHPFALSDSLIEILPNDEEGGSSEAEGDELSQVRIYNYNRLPDAICSYMYIRKNPSLVFNALHLHFGDPDLFQC
jgi:hypothetical protein